MQRLFNAYSKRSTLNTSKEAREVTQSDWWNKPAPKGSETFEFNIGDKVIATGKGGYIAGTKLIITKRWKQNGFVTYVGGGICHKKGGLIIDPANKNKSLKRNKKQVLPKGHINPSKWHYRRFVVKYSGWLLTKETEVICNVLASTVTKSKKQKTFESHYPTELALAYGLKHGLIKIGSKRTYEANQAKYHPIYFTEAGLEINKGYIPKYA